jgi:formylmethanofuran dehydrogenase subunit E
MANPRIKVSIRCNQCGERFILRGKKDKGKIDTGFKQCLCNNETDFDIEEEYL